MENPSLARSLPAVAITLPLISANVAAPAVAPPNALLSMFELSFIGGLIYYKVVGHKKGWELPKEVKKRHQW
jgi:hypothetical protein